MFISIRFDLTSNLDYYMGFIYRVSHGTLDKLQKIVPWVKTIEKSSIKVGSKIFGLGDKARNQIYLVLRVSKVVLGECKFQIVGA